MKKEVIQIEIMKSSWKTGTWCIRIGNIKGSTELSNFSKEAIIKEIKEEMDNLK